MTCEDGRFRRHRGFDHEAIHNSVRENLRARKFLRGASTISMQLAKNLYLGREKTISRKLQELILTTYLEQALTKDQIMELYLNVVEFGPMTFGIGNASSRYFNKHPASLSLGQSMYLASILPAPSRQHFGKDGKVTDGWMRYLYKLMRIAAKMRWVSEVELDYGLGEWVVYGSPDPIRLTPGPEGAEQEPGEAKDLEPEDGDPFGWKPEQAPTY
jgi:membrane carboxypeptidase/penicillin-binding protein PbpC